MIPFLYNKNILEEVINLKPIILLYNVREEKYNRMKPVLGLMGIKVKSVDNSSLGDTVEYIAWPEEYEVKKEPEILYSNDIDFEFMILCGLSKSDLDKVLNFMKKNKISISAKAMLTETNRHWSFLKLIHEIDAERKAISGKNI